MPSNSLLENDPSNRAFILKTILITKLLSEVNCGDKVSKI